MDLCLQLSKKICGEASLLLDNFIKMKFTERIFIAIPRVSDMIDNDVYDPTPRSASCEGP